jgi:hypothetical protein
MHEVIRGHDGDHGIRVAGRQDGGGPGDCVQRIAALRLAEDVRGLELR